MIHCPRCNCPSTNVARYSWKIDVECCGCGTTIELPPDYVTPAPAKKAGMKFLRSTPIKSLADLKAAQPKWLSPKPELAAEPEIGPDEDD